jgi:hypothetical protein
MSCAFSKAPPEPEKQLEAEAQIDPSDKILSK